MPKLISELPPDRLIRDLRAAQKWGMKTIYAPRPDEDSGVEADEIKRKEGGGEVDFVAGDCKISQGRVNPGYGKTDKRGRRPSSPSPYLPSS